MARTSVACLSLGILWEVSHLIIHNYKSDMQVTVPCRSI